MKEKKARVEDALHATRAAVEEGVVPGGGVALIRALRPRSSDLKGDNEDQTHGIQIALRAMEAPLREIVANCRRRAVGGAQQASPKARATSATTRPTGEFGDMIEFGILDPTKVTRTALQNAASIAGLMITTEAMVAERRRRTSRPWRRRWRRHGWHGRHGFLIQPRLRHRNTHENPRREAGVFVCLGRPRADRPGRRTGLRARGEESGR